MLRGPGGKLTRPAAKSVLQRMQQDPAWFAQGILGSTPWQAQIEILEALRDYERVAVRTCHGIGKSYIAAQAALWFLYSFRPSIVLTTAPTWRQVEKLIWKEIRSAFRRSRIRLGGELAQKSPELQVLQDEWMALGISTNHPDRFQGFHQIHILVIVDESPGVPEDIFEAIEGVLTSGHIRLLQLGNPTKTGGTFWRTFKNPDKNTKTFHIAAWDTPNFTEFGITEADLESGAWEAKIEGKELPYPGLITPKWAADRLRQWGKNSPAYQARVAGEFPSQGDNSMIPLAWIEAAMARWPDTPAGSPVDLGVDVARFGSDDSAIAPKAGRKILELRVFHGLDTMELVGEVIRAKRELSARSCKIDVIGMGAGVVDRLREQGHDPTEINVAEAPTDPEEYANRRSELWGVLRANLDPDPRVNPEPLALPPDDLLLADLSNPTYSINSRGQIVLEPKEKTKDRLGRSPDRGDAVVLACAPILPEEPIVQFDIPKEPVVGNRYHPKY